MGPLGADVEVLRSGGERQGIGSERLLGVPVAWKPSNPLQDVGPLHDMHTAILSTAIHRALAPTSALVALPIINGRDVCMVALHVVTKAARPWRVMRCSGLQRCSRATVHYLS